MGSKEPEFIWADYLVELTKDGKKVWEWRMWIVSIQARSPSPGALTTQL
jgi:hypothetical protein